MIRSHTIPAAPHGGWRIVSTENELRQLVTFEGSDNVGGLADDVRDGDGCTTRCMTSAIAAVRNNRPVALQFSDDGRLQRLRMPSRGRVVRLWKDAQGRVNFAMTGSQLVFRLVSLQIDAIDVVMNAVTTRGRIVVVDPLFDGWPVVVQAWNAAESKLRCSREFDLDLRDVSVLSKRKANEKYQTVFSLDSVRPYKSGIPFRLSSAFCHAKAHAMAETIETAAINARVGKAWAFSKPNRAITIKTTSRRSCHERWWFHVAVVVRSHGRTGGGLWVFDPTTNLAGGVLSVDEWKRGFGDALGPVHLTRTEAYRLECDEPGCEIDDPCFEPHTDGESFEDLKIARCNLACLAEEEGHPPHRCKGR
jgi:hypothetical protein